MRRFLLKSFILGITVASLFSIAWRLPLAKYSALFDGLSTVQKWVWPTSFFLMPLGWGDPPLTQVRFYSMAILSNGIIYAILGSFVYCVFKIGRNLLRG